MKLAGPMKNIWYQFFCKVILLIFFGPWAKSSRDFVRKSSAFSSKLGSHFQRKLSGEKLLENLQLVIFLNIERKTFSWLTKKSQRGFQAAFYLSMGAIRRKKLWKVFASFVDVFPDHFWYLNSKSLAGLSKLHSLYL